MAMAKKLNKFYFLLALFAHIGLVLTQSTECYFCNSEVHGAGCDDPIDPSLIQTQTCLDFETHPRQSYYVEIMDFFKKHNIFSQETDTVVRNTTIPNVCLSLTYEFSSRNVSARGCEQGQKEIESDVLDVCDYYRSILPARITNLDCLTCTENLCNYRTRRDNGAEQQMWSLKLLMVMVLAKFVF